MTSAALESAFLENGLESVDLIQELRDSMAIQFLFQQLMLGILMVGLVVGVAALGVISTRAVVERRQQAGDERCRALFGGLDLYEFALDPAVVGGETYLRRP